ncbi:MULTISPECIES: DUF5984 family protein [unclassified Kitasatospora]|uniref:DUF5984 family protein n=1 Tax=unclassified Kitasatospora TaxID=2633591 RepID=UPI002474C2F4|nr:DUF5984 family protein [Kitasatospora sp. MAP12-44]
MIQFRFGLLPVHDIHPWGGERPELSWFGLTDGWYCIDLAGHELLRYSDRTLERLRGRQSGAQPSPYVDYFVVRLWEDVLDVLAAVMEPVPADLVGFVSEDHADWPPSDGLEAAAEMDVDAESEVEAAAVWRGDHWFSMGHLRNPPELCWWRTLGEGEDVITVTWRHRPDADIEFAAPETGRVTVPTSEFVAAVTEFDRALLAAMEQRVAELEAGGIPAGVHIDLRHLRREQQDRATWLQRAWAREPTTDWAAVRAGALTLQARGAAQSHGDR